MKKKYFKLISAVHLMLFRNEETLLLKRENTGYEDGNYSVIAGHLNGNETVRQAMVREAKEEAGIVLKEKNLEFIHIMHRKGDDYERIDLFFTAKMWEGKPEIMEKNKCSELKWFHINKLPPNIIPYIKTALKNFRKKNTFSEYGW